MNIHPTSGGVAPLYSPLIPSLWMVLRRQSSGPAKWLGGEVCRRTLMVSKLFVIHQTDWGWLLHLWGWMVHTGVPLEARFSLCAEEGGEGRGHGGVEHVHTRQLCHSREYPGHEALVGV